MIVIQEMRFRAMTENDVQMTDCSYNDKPFVFRKTGEWKVPRIGMLNFTIVATDIAEDRMKEHDFDLLSQTLLRTRNPIERMSHLSDILQHTRFSCRQAQKLMRVFDSVKAVQDAIFMIYPRLIDPHRLQSLLMNSLKDKDAVEETRQRLGQHASR